MKKSIWLPLATGVLLASGCGTKDEIASSATSTASTSHSHNGVALTTPSDPKEVVRLFLDSMRQGNGTQLSSLLSSLAREEIKRKELEIAPLGSPMATFQIIEAAEQDGGMLVSSTWTEPEQPGQPPTELEVVWELRKEPDGWRICGMAVDPKNGDEVQIVDFEKLEPEKPAQDPQRMAALPNVPTGLPNNNTAPVGNYPANNGFAPNNVFPASNPPPAGNYGPAPTGISQPARNSEATGFQPAVTSPSNYPASEPNALPQSGGFPQPLEPYGNSNPLPPIVPGNYSLPQANSSLPPENNSNPIRR
ncbi:MAG TPA: hypothetical protein VM260_10790, partial [Pirellula sp.]|nr:hypothetical protein [Pirellula sp.]